MKQVATWAQTLKARACRNRAAREVVESNDMVAVYVKNIRPGYMIPPISWIVPFKPERRFALDRIGTYIWTQCDGSRTMEDIIEAFATHHRLTFHEARAAVTQYVQELVKRGVLAMILPPDESEAAS